MDYPKKILHWINNQEIPSAKKGFLPKYDPATGEVISQVARGRRADVKKAVASAMAAFNVWSARPIINRADLLRTATQLIQERKKEIDQITAIEAGKLLKEGIGEIGAVIEMGFFVAGEGRRFYGRTTTSAVPNRLAMTLRQPVGVCALITPANNPFAGLAWKVFPALLCGNTAILKPSENTPYTAILFAKILKEVGVPSGVFSVVQGFGDEAGMALVSDPRVDLISFTGSVAAGRIIQRVAGERLAKVCLEMGGKNALIVCDDADLEAAVEAAILSAFSSAGQRCAASSRIIIFNSIYEKFKDLFVQRTKKLKVGLSDKDDFGPLIRERQLNNMMKTLEDAIARGAKVLTGGHRLSGGKYKKGYYLEPTILENVSPKDEISRQELFGPITILYKVRNLKEAITLNNNSPFGLTAAIHTNNIHRIQVFLEKCRTGLVSVNGLTYGSEPHLPFGGLKNSGTGWREAGTEALDIYSEWKTIYIRYFPEKI